MKYEEFRIVEYNGRFRVQRLLDNETGRGRKKKTVSEWTFVSDRGYAPLYSHGITIIEPMKSFKTIEAARDMIKIIIRGNIYHTAI